MGDDGSSVEYVFPRRGESSPPRCPHDDRERLGLDAGQNEYLRCLECGAVIVGFTANDEWQDRREELSVESRDWNPLLDALRSNQYGGSEQSGQSRTDGTGSDTLVARARRTWRQFWQR